MPASRFRRVSCSRRCCGTRCWRRGSRPRPARFRAGYDFLLLRCESGELDAEIGHWWEKFQHADEAARAGMLLKETAGAGKKRRRLRRRKKPAAAAVTEIGGAG